MKDEEVFYEEIKGDYDFVVTTMDDNHTETMTYKTVEQVLSRIKNDLLISCCHGLLNNIRIEIKRK